MKKCPSRQAEVEDGSLRCPRCGAPLEEKEESGSLTNEDGLTSLPPVLPSGVGKERMPREKKLLVGSIASGSLGIVLGTVAFLVGGLPAAVFAGGVGAVLSVYGLLAAFQWGMGGKPGLPGILSFLVPAIGLLTDVIALLLGFLL